MRQEKQTELQLMGISIPGISVPGISIPGSWAGLGKCGQEGCGMDLGSSREVRVDLGMAPCWVGVWTGAEVGTSLLRAWWGENDGVKGGVRKSWDIQGLRRSLGLFM